MKKDFIIVLITVLIILGGLTIKTILEDNPIEIASNDIKEETVSISETNEISKYIPKNINKITIINNLSDKSNPTIKNIEDIDKIKEFMNLIFETNWDEKDENQMSSNFDGALYQIEIIGDTKTILNMQGIRRT